MQLSDADTAKVELPDLIWSQSEYSYSGYPAFPLASRQWDGSGNREQNVRSSPAALLVEPM